MKFPSQSERSSFELSRVFERDRHVRKDCAYGVASLPFCFYNLFESNRIPTNRTVRNRRGHGMEEKLPEIFRIGTLVSRPGPHPYGTGELSLVFPQIED